VDGAALLQQQERLRQQLNEVERARAEAQMPSPQPRAEPPGSFEPPPTTRPAEVVSASPLTAAPEPRTTPGLQFFCPWCGAGIDFQSKASTAVCGSCRRSAALGQCLSCKHVGISRMDSRGIHCSGCGAIASPPGASSTADKLISGGATVAKAGCALTALVWIGIPLLFFVVVAVLVALGVGQ
jgi:hypothetical protein